MDFALIALRLLPKTSLSIKKILQEEWFLFNSIYILDNEKKQLVKNEKYPISDDFYASNININAIVGKNGSGKSSIIELIYRIVNNFAVNILGYIPRTAADNLRMVKGVHAELYFLVNGNLCYIKSEDEISGIDFGDGLKIYGQKAEEQSSEPKILNQWKDTKEILSKLFYTIGINYSFHAYNSVDYYDEGTKDSDGKPLIWIDSLFHKNDGYLTPIVLNPYRDHGVVDLNNEFYLTNYRLAALLWQYKLEEKEFVDGYSLNGILFQYDSAYVESKYKTKNTDTSKYTIYKVKDKENSLFYAIINAYGFPFILTQEYKNSNSIKEAYRYLVYKTLSISNKYPSYDNYIKIENKNLNMECNSVRKKEIQNLVDEINRDYSHITLKIRQTLLYIKKLLKNNYSKNNIWAKDYGIGAYTDKKLSQLDNIIASFPPPFFKIKIYLDRGTSKRIEFGLLSSGERQLLFSMCTILYHIKNIMSIDARYKHRIKYRHINIILDEIELCFHPEYQRIYISKIIEYITDLKMNKGYFINILMSTHSPFILSDIPNCNILYLKEGNQVNKTVDIEPFGANIHDILYQSFFLEHGSIGELSAKKIESVLSEINKAQQQNRNLKEDEFIYCLKIIRLIGEPLIKNKLLLMLEDVYDNRKNIVQERIDFISSQLEKEKRELDKL